MDIHKTKTENRDAWKSKLIPQLNHESLQKNFWATSKIGNGTCVLNSIMGESKSRLGLIPGGMVRHGDPTIGEAKGGVVVRNLAALILGLPRLEARLSSESGTASFPAKSGVEVGVLCSPYSSMNCNPHSVRYLQHYLSQNSFKLRVDKHKKNQWIKGIELQLQWKKWSSLSLSTFNWKMEEFEWHWREENKEYYKIETETNFWKEDRN